MVRGRAAGRGTRRGAASASQRAQTDGGDDVVVIKEEPSSTATPSAFPIAAAASADSSEQSAPPPTVATVRRGAAATRATRGTTTTGRFRPKNVRRDETERDALAQRERQKADERAAEERRARGRSRFRSKRSRGDTMGSRGGRPISGASGPFAGGAAGGGVARAGGSWFGGGGGGGGFSGAGKFESKGPGFSHSGEGGYREPRINADKLHAMTQQEDLDSDDEAMIAALQSRAGSVMPMGIYRKEHKDAPVIVATAAELEAQERAANRGQDEDSEEESLWVDGSGPPAEQPEEEGTWDTGSKPIKVKKEPTDDNAMDLDTEVKPPLEKIDKGKQPLAKMKIKKAALRDPEESMIRTDLSLLASELGAIAITEDDTESKGEGQANKDGRLYLFQFPPLLPPLKQVAAPQPRVKVKDEETQPISLHSTPAATNPTTPVDLTHENGQDDEDEDEDDSDEEEEEKHGFRSQLLSSGGMVGKLNVRKSGKVELDWGGHILEMSPAAGMNFLTTAVIVEESDEKPQNGVTGGESIGMGKIMGRFVLAPIWNEEEDWEVTPEELVIG
ncbi:hypothetical protein PT974_06686 [Cladobotryum mycophilum]|uniref:Uncharacterized protein n=1 Tax=Cladobotryum mycophilum TaxID=491253 RepID=A0ABR0SMY0_9HYPO